MTDKLDPLREQIDAIDAQILELLSRRGKVAQEAVHVAAEIEAPACHPEREAQILRRVADNNPGPLEDHDVQTIFREIMSSCRTLERRATVAYLGPTGTFSEQAVFQHFGGAVKGLPCASIDEVFRATEAGTADYGVVPVENSSEGAVNRTLDLLLATTCIISGEVSIPVHLNLMTRSGRMDGIEVVCAHPQALAQCQAWLNQHHPHIERRPVASNAEAAVLASRDPTVAAVASEMASRQYKLGVIQAHIQDDQHNRTRFLVIGRQAAGRSGHDRTSLVLAVPNKAGAVYNLLAPLAQHGVSMTRFESRPARMGTWEYNFYVDMEGHIEDAALGRALDELKDAAAFFKMLGSYPAAR